MQGGGGWWWRGHVLQLLKARGRPPTETILLVTFDGNSTFKVLSPPSLHRVGTRHFHFLFQEESSGVLWLPENCCTTSKHPACELTSSFGTWTVKGCSRRSTKPGHNTCRLGYEHILEDNDASPDGKTSSSDSAVSQSQALQSQRERSILSIRLWICC